MNLAHRLYLSLGMLAWLSAQPALCTFDDFMDQTYRTMDKTYKTVKDYVRENPGKTFAGALLTTTCAAAWAKYGLVRATALAGLGASIYHVGSKYVGLTSIENDYLNPKQNTFCFTKNDLEESYPGIKSEDIPLYLWKPHFSVETPSNDKKLQETLQKYNERVKNNELTRQMISSAIAHIEQCRKSLVEHYDKNDKNNRFYFMISNIKLADKKTEKAEKIDEKNADKKVDKKNEKDKKVVQKTLGHVSAWDWVFDRDAMEKLIAEKIKFSWLNPFEHRARLLYCKLYLAQHWLEYLQDILLPRH